MRPRDNRIATRFCGWLGYTLASGEVNEMLAVMALNYAVNFMLLLGTQQLTGSGGGIWSVLTASLLGAAHAGGCMLSGFSFLAGLHWRLVCLILMSLLVFGADWKPMAVFLFLTLALGGAAMAVGRGDGWPLLGLAGAVWLLSRYAFGRHNRLLPVSISGSGGEVKLTALLDTGNELRDPITRERVLVVGMETAERLTGLNREQLAAPFETIASGCCPGLRLVPYHSVGTQKGMLLAKRYPQVSIGRNNRPGIVAFAPQSIGGEGYEALVGGI